MNDRSFDSMVKRALRETGRKDAALMDRTDGSEAPPCYRLFHKLTWLLATAHARHIATYLKNGTTRVALSLFILLSVVFTTVMGFRALRERLWRTVLHMDARARLPRQTDIFC